MALDIEFDRMNPSNYAILVNNAINDNEVFNLYVRAYTEIGLMHGPVVGKQINQQLKQFENPLFSEVFQSTITTWLRQNAGGRITSVNQNLTNFIIKFIADKFDENLSVDQITRELKKLINSPKFYRWQILRIVRTETTAAANYAAIVAAETSGVVLEKVWVSSLDVRTRTIPPDKFDHKEMEGVKVAPNEPFSVQGDLLQFPGDPNGQAANVINCRCTVALVPKRDRDGRLVFV